MTQTAVNRIGLLTGGGDCPGLNAVIRAVVKTATVKYGMSVVGFADGFGGLVQNCARILTEQDISGILPRGGTILGTTNRDNPFHYPVMEDGQKRFRDMSDQALAHIKHWDIDALVVIGGDGSLAIARDFSNKGLAVIGVPKTIDNDLHGTDVTFGFDSAVAVASEAIDRLHTTAESHHRVMVLETMGRYAGWIALVSGIAGGADCILIPEIPFILDRVMAKIQHRVAQGKRFSIVVVAEGAHPVDRDMVVQRIVADSTDPVRLGGIGNQVGQWIEAATGIETRVTVLGHLQRGGSPTAYDRILATRFGVAAVELAARGQFGQMVALRGADITAIPLSRAVGKPRTVPLDGALVQAARALGIALGD